MTIPTLTLTGFALVLAFLALVTLAVVVKLVIPLILAGWEPVWVAIAYFVEYSVTVSDVPVYVGQINTP